MYDMHPQIQRDTRNVVVKFSPSLRGGTFPYKAFLRHFNREMLEGPQRTAIYQRLGLSNHRITDVIEGNGERSLFSIR